MHQEQIPDDAGRYNPTHAMLAMRQNANTDQVGMVAEDERRGGGIRGGQRSRRRHLGIRSIVPRRTLAIDRLSVPSPMR